MKLNALRNLLLIKTLCIVFFLPLKAGAEEISWFVTNKTDDNDRPIATSDIFFSCSDRIYTMATLDNLKKGSNVITFDWIDPSGKQRETELYRFNHSGYRQQIWAWLTLHPPPRTIALRLFNPSYGMQYFIGIWKVEVSINGIKFGKKQFEVLC